MCKVTRLLLCFCLVFAFILSAKPSAASVRIGGESLRANGQLAHGFEYTGPCPVDLQFGWGVIATQPTSLNYYFVRSDGGRSSQSVTTDLTQANRSFPIYDHWNLGANKPQFANYSGWVNVVIDSPNHVEGRIKFTLHCR